MNLNHRKSFVFPGWLYSCLALLAKCLVKISVANSGQVLWSCLISCLRESAPTKHRGPVGQISVQYWPALYSPFLLQVVTLMSSLEGGSTLWVCPRRGTFLVPRNHTVAPVLRTPPAVMTWKVKSVLLGGEGRWGEDRWYLPGEAVAQLPSTVN